MTCPSSLPAKNRRLSPAFAAAERYAKAIPSKKNKRMAIHRLCQMLCAAILAGPDNEVRK